VVGDVGERVAHGVAQPRAQADGEHGAAVFQLDDGELGLRGLLGQEVGADVGDGHVVELALDRRATGLGEQQCRKFIPDGEEPVTRCRPRRTTERVRGYVVMEVPPAHCTTVAEQVSHSFVPSLRY